MSNFLDKFPLVIYKTTDANTKASNFETITDITFRVAFIKDTLNNALSYYTYDIQDSDTPENLADKYYGSAEAHWIILYANNIYDPQYDWPLKERAFRKYLVSKYQTASGKTTEKDILAWTKQTIHHYEKIVERKQQDLDDDTKTRDIYQVDIDPLANNMSETVPYDNANTLPIYGTTEFYTLPDGSVIEETITGAPVTIYDYENELNEKKRTIKIIRKDYLAQIMQEFELLTNNNDSNMNNNNNNFRRLM